MVRIWYSYLLIAENGVPVKPSGQAVCGHVFLAVFDLIFKIPATVDVAKGYWLNRRNRLSFDEHNKHKSKNHLLMSRLTIPHKISGKKVAQPSSINTTFRMSFIIFFRLAAAWASATCLAFLAFAISCMHS